MSVSTNNRLNVIASHLNNNKSRENEAPLKDILHVEPTAGIRVGGVEDYLRRIQSWKIFLNETVPERIKKAKNNTRTKPPSVENTYDVVVVGFGAAGASAALDAADLGKNVLLIDRYDGGGSTRRSGGLYYAGGGTRAQKDAGIVDDPENMFVYLKMENDGAVDDSTIKRFCTESAATFDWLEHRVGVPFTNKEGKTVFYDKKTSYPPSYCTLTYSGNETAAPFYTKAKAAARGNRVFGDYLTGNIMFTAFERAVESHPNITIQLHTKVQGLIMSDDGKSCLGVLADRLMEEFESTNVMLHEIGSGSSMLDPTRETDARCKVLENHLFKEFSYSQRMLARKGVIICTGGFFFNQEMVAKFAPKYMGYMPLGNLGDDGLGINLCKNVGCALDRMNRCSAWKFINPPYSFVRGVVVGADGERVGNEDTYGATFADFLVQKHGGKGWLVIDQEAWDEANEDCMNPESGLQEDQRMQGLANLHKNNVKAENVSELAQKIKAPKLQSTLEQYNSYCVKGIDPQFGKLPKFLKALSGNLYAIRLDMVGNKYWPTPCMTLGGVKVDGASGLAIRESDGQTIRGLYVAGRAAVGVASNYYVSGLSVADAVFSGRRAGKHSSCV
jgi:3-oxo-5alpha-steroid 4-dehydrogenase